MNSIYQSLRLGLKAEGFAIYFDITEELCLERKGIMYSGKRVSMLVLILTGLLLLCSCGQRADENTGTVPESPNAAVESAAAEKAHMILQTELDKEVKAGNLLKYDELSTEPLVTEKEEAMQIAASYRATFGDQTGTSGFTTDMKCVLTIRQKSDGTFSEIRDKREYEIVNDGIFDNFSGIINHPYTAWISKDEVYGKSREEIALILFRQWMDTLQDWNTSARTFLVTRYESPQVSLIASVDDENWGTTMETEGVRPKHRGALASWIYSCQCRYQYLGYTSNVSLGTCWSGKALGVEPFWVEEFAPGLTTKHFVLTEWQDSYTLETKKHCLGTIGKAQ